MGSLRWVPIIVKPNPSLSTPELAVLPEMGSTSEKVSCDSVRSLATSETTSGVSSLVGFGNPDAEVILEVGKGPPKSTGCIPAVSEIAGGSPFSLVVPAPISTEGAMVVWTRSSSPGSLVESDPADSCPSLVFGPFTHKLFSGLGLRNRPEFPFPEAEPIPLSCCPSDKVRGLSGKGSSKLLLKMALKYRHPLGITCDGSEGQISTLYENLIDSHDKKVTGSSPKSVNKGTRQLNRLFCSVNYEAHSGSSSSGRHKGRVHNNLL
jgi:hypothetical protein